MKNFREIMDYKKIPKSEIEWVKENWAKFNRKIVVQRFKEWGVIGNVCGACGIIQSVDEFIKFWVREKLI